MKKLYITLILSSICAISLNAQSKHVQWTYESKEISENLYQISIAAQPDFGWHIYDTLKTDFGPTATSITFDKSSGAETVGNLEISGKLHKSYDETYMMNVGYYEGKVVFTQKIRIPAGTDRIKAEVEWMSCNDVNCDRPAVQTLDIPVK